jgi:hypothetical protein
MMEYPNSEYIGVAKQRIKDMGIPLEIAEKAIQKI